MSLPTVANTATAPGVATEESLSYMTARLNLTLTGVPTAESVGATTLALAFTLPGIPTAEELGQVLFAVVEEFGGFFPGRGWKRRDYYASADIEDLAAYELGIEGYEGIIDFEQFERRITRAQMLEQRRIEFGTSIRVLKEELAEERAARVKRAKAVVTVATGSWVAVRLLLWFL